MNNTGRNMIQMIVFSILTAAVYLGLSSGGSYLLIYHIWKIAKLPDLMFDIHVTTLALSSLFFASVLCVVIFSVRQHFSRLCIWSRIIATISFSFPLTLVWCCLHQPTIVGIVGMVWIGLGGFHIIPYLAKRQTPG